MSNKTHEVLRNFTADDAGLSGKQIRGQKLDFSKCTPAYVAMLEKAKFINKLGTPKPDMGDGRNGVIEGDKVVGSAQSIGSLDGKSEMDELDEAISEELGDEEEDLPADGDEEQITEETKEGDKPSAPICDRINAVPANDKDALLAIADEFKSTVKRNFGFDNMKKALLVEFAGK